MTQPYWAGGVDPSVREIPGEVARAEPPLTWEQLGATVQFFLDTFIGQIAIAFGGISILGWRPLDFLAEWGQDRVEQAQENYLLALNAQGVATFATSQISIIAGAGLATDVSGGVAVSAAFNEAAATTLSGFSRTSDGPGAGTFGPNGSGKAVWVRSGGLYRRHLDIYDTPLATDYQAALLVTATPVQGPYLGSSAYTYLVLRCNAARDTFVWARISHVDVTVGKTVSGTWADPWVTPVAATMAAGDQWTFLAGTDTDDRQFIVKRNGVTLIDYTDDDASPSAFGEDYRYAGLASLAADRAILIVPLLDQTVPAEIDAWAAADRLSTSI